MFRPDGDDGHYLVGARGDQLGRGPVSPHDRAGWADLRELERLSAIVARRFPAMAGGVWRGSWSSWLDFTPDGNPVVDLVPGRDNLLVATGMSGHGFKLVPAYGIAAAELLTGRQGRDALPGTPSRTRVCAVAARTLRSDTPARAPADRAHRREPGVPG